MQALPWLELACFLNIDTIDIFEPSLQSAFQHLITIVTHDFDEGFILYQALPILFPAALSI